MATDSGDRAEGDAHFRHALTMRTMVLGRLVTAALHAAAVLGVADTLHDGPRGGHELAADLNVDPVALERLLEALTELGVLEVWPDGRFALTALGGTLRSGVPGSAHPAALLAGTELGRSWDEVIVAVREGRAAFPTVFGTDVFSYMGAHPELSELFYRSQDADLDVVATELVKLADGRQLVIDVGGGDGALMERILLADRTVFGTILDLPSTAKKARARMRAAGLDDRCTVVDGNFFSDVPPGGDLYVLRDILHDWPDERCVELLNVCRKAMPSRASLLVVERVSTPAPSEDSLLYRLLDLYMLVAVGGRERSLPEWERLVDRAGLRLCRRHRLGSQAMALLLDRSKD